MRLNKRDQHDHVCVSGSPWRILSIWRGKKKHQTRGLAYSFFILLQCR